MNHLLKINKISERLSKIKAVSEDELALLGYALGAVYSLQKAIKFGFVDLTGTNKDPNYVKILNEVARKISAEEMFGKSEESWVSGFYFNSAIHRISALNDRIGKFLKKRKDYTPTIRKEVNRLKHDIDGVISGREVNLDESIDALSLLTHLLELSFPGLPPHIA